jgi:hypothetical protein
MKNFKEWLSDYLRYFMLLLALVLLGGIIYIGIRVYQHYDSPTAGEVIEILTEAGELTEAESESVKETEAASEVGTEADTEAETKNSAGETSVNGAAGTDAQAKDTSDNASAQAETSASENGGQASNETQSTGASQDTAQQNSQSGTASAQTESEVVIQVQSETQAATEAEPVYRTMTGACNFRSGPGYEYEVMAVYPAGTVVEYLGIVEGWCEVRIDGVIGYMGQRFFE